jgi:hypothetical protein
MLVWFRHQSGSRKLGLLCFVLEDAVGTDDMNQATGADDFLNTTIIEGLADDVCPVTRRLQKSPS